MEVTKLRTLMKPSTMSIRPTESSMLSPTRTGITSSKAMTATPKETIVSVCPMPQQIPIKAAR